MGYSHYLLTPNGYTMDSALYNRLGVRIRSLVEFFTLETGYRLLGADEEPVRDSVSYQKDPQEILVDVVGEDSRDCETLVISRTLGTLVAVKPSAKGAKDDALVTAILLLVKAHLRTAVALASDGELRDWSPGAALLRRCFPTFDIHPDLSPTWGQEDLNVGREHALSKVSAQATPQVQPSAGLAASIFVTVDEPIEEPVEDMPEEPVEVLVDASEASEASTGALSLSADPQYDEDGNLLGEGETGLPPIPVLELE